MLKELNMAKGSWRQFAFGFLAMFPLLGLYIVTAKLLRHNEWYLWAWLIALCLMLGMLWRTFAPHNYKRALLGMLTAAIAMVGAFFVIFNGLGSID